MSVISVFNELGQISPGQMFPGQMSLWQLSTVKGEPGKLPSKFGHSRISNSWDIADIDLPGVQSHFMSNPTNVILGCVGVFNVEL